MTGREGDWRTTLVEVNQAGKPPAKVVIAHLHPGDVATSFQQSLTNTTLHDAALHGRLRDDGRLGLISTQQGAGRLERGRNEATAMFLDRHPNADLLMFVDSDMGWDFDGVERLAEIVDRDHPIVGGLCFGVKPISVGPQQAMEQEEFPTLYRWNDGPPGGFDPAYEYPPDELVEVSGTGAAFVMIHRRALESLRETHGDNWWSTITRDGVTFGEDLSFCLRAKDAGLPIHVHTGVRTSHKKDRWYTEASYRDGRRPASSAVTVVIPVKDNLDLTRDLVGQLIAQGGWTDLLIFDNGSTDPEMVEWLAAQGVADVFSAEGAGIHEMWNAGIEEAVARHGLADVVILNNDLKLGPRFCQRLIGGLRESNAMAVSGNYDARRVSGVQPVRGICAGRYDGTGGLAGFAFALRSEWVASGYRFPTDLDWYFGDNDLCLSLEQAGCWYGIVGDARVEHVGGGGQTSGSLVGPSYEKDRAAFEAKWSKVAA